MSIQLNNLSKFSSISLLKGAAIIATLLTVSACGQKEQVAQQAPPQRFLHMLFQWITLVTTVNLLRVL